MAIAVERVEAVAPDTAVPGVEHVDADGTGEARVSGRHRVWQSGLAALRDKNAVRRFSEDTGITAERVAMLGKWLVPSADDVIWTRTDWSGYDGLRCRWRCGLSPERSPTACRDQCSRR